jgi:hypothetical protein
VLPKAAVLSDGKEQDMDHHSYFQNMYAVRNQKVSQVPEFGAKISYEFGIHMNEGKLH